MPAQAKRDAGEEMSLDALSDLVAAYEDEHYPIAPASDADMLRHLMQAKHVNQARLSKDTGIAKSTVSEVLAGKKAFSRKIIRKPAAGGTDCPNRCGAAVGSPSKQCVECQMFRCCVWTLPRGIA